MWKVLSSLIQEEKLLAVADSTVVSGPGVSMESSALMLKTQHEALKKIKRLKI